MGPELVTQVLQSLCQQAAGIVGVLAPIGLQMALGFTIAGIAALGASVMFSPAFISPLIEFLLFASLATFFAGNWDLIVMGSLTTADQILGLFGVAGPVGLFTAAAHVGQRLATEPISWGLSWEGSFGAMFKAMLLSISVPIAMIGLSIPGILAVLAQLNLILGALMGPLIISGLAFSVTRPLAVGAINFVITATVRIVTLGLVAHLFANAIEAQMDVPGTDVGLDMAAIAGVLFTAVLAAIVGFSANSLAGSLVGGGVGGMGLSSFSRPAAALQTASAGAGAVMTGAGAAARAGGGAAGGAVGAAGRSAAGVVGRMGGGSPFP